MELPNIDNQEPIKMFQWVKYPNGTKQNFEISNFIVELTTKLVTLELISQKAIDVSAN
jgi:hypothetical protein